MSRLLITAEADEARTLLNAENRDGPELLHLPLEQFEYRVDEEQARVVTDRLDECRFVLFSSVRNVRFFVRWVQNAGLEEIFKEKIHLVTDRSQTRLLEMAGIPPICPAESARPIDLVEFLLRLSVKGTVLCPVTEDVAEELPGLLEEIGMPRLELGVCGEVPMDSERLETLRDRLGKSRPDRILFHSRGSVIRTRAAFPELNLDHCELLAASEGVAWKLRQEGLEPDRIAQGSWMSVREMLERAGKD